MLSGCALTGLSPIRGGLPVRALKSAASRRWASYSLAQASTKGPHRKLVPPAALPKTRSRRICESGRQLTRTERGPLPGKVLAAGTMLQFTPVGEWIAVSRCYRGEARTPRYWLVSIDEGQHSGNAEELQLNRGDSLILEWRGETQNGRCAAAGMEMPPSEPCAPTPPPPNGATLPPHAPGRCTTRHATPRGGNPSRERPTTACHAATQGQRQSQQQRQARWPSSRTKRPAPTTAYERV